MKYPDTVVENVHLNDSLMTLCYRISDELLPASQEEEETAPVDNKTDVKAEKK